MFVGCLVAVCAASSVSAGTLANFTDPTQVNLLQRWSPVDGSWMITASGTHNGGNIGSADLQKAMDYPGDGIGWRVTVGEGSVIMATYTFAEAVTIDAVSLSFYRAAHMPSPDSVVTFAFDSGAPVIVAPEVCPSGVGAVRYVIPQRTTTTMTVTFDYAVWDGTSNGFFELDGIGAYLAPSQSLAIDGTYNIFHEENSQSTLVDGSYANAWRWADCNGRNYANPPNEAGEAVWHFSQAYTFDGASLTHAFNNADKCLYGAQVWVSNDGKNWTALNADPIAWQRSYLVFDTALSAEDRTGDWVKLTWGPGSMTGLSEITSFQLFGSAVPEPATMGLLALGGLALPRRRRA